jgi:mannose-6-phosphate isomerase-like protein (cupin superfamily)
MVKVIALADARAMSLPGRTAREIIAAHAGAERMTVRLVEIAPAKPGEIGRGPHVHQGFEECIHVLDGRGITRTDTGEFPVAAGDTVLVPPGERHATYNTGSTRLRLLCFFPVNDIRPGTREFADWSEQEGPGDA